MAFKMSTQKSSGKISEVTIGTGDKAIKLGGQNVLPFYSFDGDTGNVQKVGVEINDIYPESWIDCYKEMYKDVANDPAEWAKYVQDKFYKKHVWFMISEYLGKYYIAMYYDNEYNMAHGEDV